MKMYIQECYTISLTIPLSITNAFHEIARTVKAKRNMTYTLTYQLKKIYNVYLRPNYAVLPLAPIGVT